jgi:hypothetical protein
VGQRRRLQHIYFEIVQSLILKFLLDGPNKDAHHIKKVTKKKKLGDSPD